MASVKKILISGLGLSLLASVSAHAAEVNLGINLGGAAPIYAAPAPVYAPAPYYPAPIITTYDPRHRRHDYEYWHNRRWHDHHR